MAQQGWWSKEGVRSAVGEQKGDLPVRCVFARWGKQEWNVPQIHNVNPSLARSCENIHQVPDGLDPRRSRSQMVIRSQMV